MVLISSSIDTLNHLLQLFLTWELLKSKKKIKFTGEQETRSSALLTQRLEGQRGEQDEKNRNQILESDHSQVAEDTSHLENRLFSLGHANRKLLRFGKQDFRPTFL